MVVVCPVAVARCHIGCDSIFLSGSVPQDFTAFADALVRLDVGAGGHFLQEDLDWLRTGFAFEGQDTGWLGWHGTGK
jgi:hypothetical protein